MCFDAFDVKFILLNLTSHDQINLFVSQIWISLQQVELVSHGLLVMSGIEKDDLVWDYAKLIQGEGLDLGTREPFDYEVFVLFFALRDSLFEDLDHDIVWDIRVLVECCLNLGTEVSLFLDLELEKRTCLYNV